MNHRQPPTLAIWMLEHLTSGDRDEAISGDLLEVFRAGRSSGWYWRQVLAACIVSWFKSLRARLSLLVFVVVWSILAPAWETIVDRFENNTNLLRYARQMDWPFSTLAEFTCWFCLSLVFIWSGILLYFLCQTRLAKSLGKRKIRRAFVLAPVVFLPVYWWAFILMNLFAYPGLVIDRRTITPMGELTDLRMWADVVRLPYMITLLLALWGAIPRWRSATEAHFAESTPMESSTESDSMVLLSKLGSFPLKRFFGFVVAAGLVNAMIAAFLICRLPESHSPTIRSLFMSAAMYVLVGALAGVGGSWLYWNNPSSPFRENAPLRFSLFALVCAAGWIWVPPMMLLYEQVSAASALVAMIGAFALASGLRSATSPIFAPAQLEPDFDNYGQELFAESLYRAPMEMHGYVIAISLFAAGAALITRSNYTAAALLAISASIFAWKRTFPSARSTARRQAYRRAARRLALAAIPALLVTMWALLDGVAHRNHLAEAALAASQRGTAGDDANANSKPKTSANGLGGYESLILWPYPEKKEIVPPIKFDETLLAPGTTKPLVIRFDGVYRYIQPPDESPGPNAHKAHGTPLAVNIESSNSCPLLMDAHQELSRAIPTGRVRKIQVEIENRDNRPGVIALGLLLKDGSSSRGKTLYLGSHPLESTEPGHFFVKSSPLSETVEFAVPDNAKIRNFSEMTVLVLPDIEHTLVAPKIAIREFQLIPR